MSDFSKNTALVLSGGGARAAYQAGVLKAISEILDHPADSPFPIITGTSAGAINASLMAANSHQFSKGVFHLSQVWKSFTPQDIYRTDLTILLKNAGRWFWNFIRPKKNLKKPLSLLDNSPLRQLTKNIIDYPNIQKNIDKGLLQALCTTAYNYTSGDSVSFYQAHSEQIDWNRFRRVGNACNITAEHLLASSAIPMVFPSEQIDHHFYGDGALRFLAPLSPAIHLGAKKVFVITVDPLRDEVEHKSQIPDIGGISGHLLDSIFIDSLESDLERLIRVNELLSHISQDDLMQENLSLRPVDAFVISPSTDPAELACQYFKHLPKGLKFFFRRLGINDDSGESILSYLLFDKHFTQELIELGYQDAIKQEKNIIAFLKEHQ